MVMKAICPKCDHSFELVYKDSINSKLEWVKLQFDKLIEKDGVMEPCLKRCKEIVDEAIEE